MTNRYQWLRSQSLFWIVRFIIVGAAASLIYVIIAALLHMYLEVGEYKSSILAYLIAIPVSFFGHKKITFRDKDRWGTQFIRFFILQLLNILIVLMAVYALQPLGRTGYLMSLFLGVCLMPITSFLAMRFFIFLADHRPFPKQARHDEP